MDAATLPSPLLDLPPETLSYIVKLAKEQDDALPKRLEISSKKVKKATEQLAEESRQLGRSVWNLYGTSRTLRDLARPYCFQTVLLSQTTKLFFHESILVPHGHLIRHLDFNPCPQAGSPRTAFTALVVSSLAMSQLDHLSFTCKDAGATLSYMTEILDSIRTSPNSAYTPWVPALAFLRNRVKRLSCPALRSADFLCAINFFSGIEHVSRDLTSADDIDAEGASIASLCSLRHLELGTDWSFSGIDLEAINATVVPTTEGSKLPQSWQNLSFSPSLHTLSFATPVLYPSDWRFFVALRDTLRVLNLEVVSSDDLAQDLTLRTPFLHLTSLDLCTCIETARDILPLLSSSPLRALSLHFIDIFDDKDTLAPFINSTSGLIVPFLGTLRELGFYTWGWQPNSVTECFEGELERLGFKIPPRHKAHDSLLFYAPHPATSEQSRTEIDRFWREEFTSVGWVRTIRQVLKRTLESLDQAERWGDEFRINIIGQACRDLVALRFLDED